MFRLKKNGGTMILGGVLMALGLIVLICSVPCWLWLMVLGLALILVGIILVFG